nr:hypothetical protein [Tanacetum cinerariifolium]
FGKLLEEIHETLTQFGKKRDKISTLHEVVSRIRIQETASQFLATLLELTRDAINNYVTTSEHNSLKENLRRFRKATVSGFW